MLRYYLIPIRTKLLLSLFYSEIEISKSLSGLSIKLGINNIRILRKIERAVKSVDRLLREFEPKIFDQALQTLTLFGWCYYSNNEDFYGYIKSRYKIYVKKEDKTFTRARMGCVIK